MNRFSSTLPPVLPLVTPTLRLHSNVVTSSSPSTRPSASQNVWQPTQPLTGAGKGKASLWTALALAAVGLQSCASSLSLPGASLRDTDARNMCAIEGRAEEQVLKCMKEVKDGVPAASEATAAQPENGPRYGDTLGQQLGGTLDNVNNATADTATQAQKEASGAAKEITETTSEVFGNLAESTAKHAAKRTVEGVKWFGEQATSGKGSDDPDSDGTVAGQAGRMLNTIPSTVGDVNKNIVQDAALNAEKDRNARIARQQQAAAEQKGAGTRQENAQQDSIKMNCGRIHTLTDENGNPTGTVSVPVTCSLVGP